MILVAKSQNIPAVLEGEGKAATDALCVEYNAGKRGGFDFNNSIYSDDIVKTTLIDDQHKKCCYCESKPLVTSWGAVEHFRPKGSVKQENGEKILYPGYYWLAYDWENLFFCCNACNTNHKGVQFPLVDPSKRARSHNDTIAKEQPLLIKPSGPDDPRAHINFRGDSPVGKSKEGRKTIKVLGLRERPDLIENRLKDLAHLRGSVKVILDYLSGSVPYPKETALEAKRVLEKAIMPESEYSSMAIDYCLLAGVWTTNL